VSAPELQHRIFLAPARPMVAVADAHAHWRTHHGRLMLELPHLAGYVQNRPLTEWWPHLGFLACAETWFADREAEKAAYASEWYRDEITPDELRMFARDAAWSSPVTGIEELHAGPPARLRVLAFGGAAANLDGIVVDDRVERLRLARAAPGTAGPVVVSAYTDDAAKARHIALRLGGLVFVAEATAIVAPPVAPWTEAIAVVAA
jgi:hypothetical protein